MGPNRRPYCAVVSALTNQHQRESGLARLVEAPPKDPILVFAEGAKGGEHARFVTADDAKSQVSGSDESWNNGGSIASSSRGSSSENSSSDDGDVAGDGQARTLTCVFSPNKAATYRSLGQG